MRHQKALEEILGVTRCLVPANNRTVVENIFLDAGIKVSQDLSFLSFTGDPGDCVKALMEKSTSVPAVRVVVKRVLRKNSIVF